MPIAIIGAGLAGLSAARQLREAGVASVIFEKSRGLGGRMSTRRVDHLQFDHGAQYFTAKGARFRALVADWQTQGAAAPWGEGSFVGAPAMTSPARALGEGHHILTECQVSALQRGPDGWRIETAAGPVGVEGNGHFDGVFLAIPAPQAQALLASCALNLPGIEAVQYGPCIALMLAFDAPINLTADRMKLEDPVIRWIARDSSKPGRPQGHTTLVVHAGPEWSRAHLEETPDSLADVLLTQFQNVTGNRAVPIYKSAHRWRYALVEQAVGTSCLFDAAAGIGACGDWCLGPRVEAAFDSGEALANAFLASRST